MSFRMLDLDYAKRAFIELIACVQPSDAAAFSSFVNESLETLRVNENTEALKELYSIAARLRSQVYFTSINEYWLPRK